MKFVACVNAIICVSVKKRRVDPVFALREVILMKANPKSQYITCMLGIPLGLGNLGEFRKFE